MTEQELDVIKDNLSVRGKNGIGFLIAALIIWSTITIIFLIPLELQQKNIFMLLTTGFMFPLSLLFSKLIKAEWKFEGSPLASLGLYLNFAQIIYFPIVFWAIVHSPEQAIMFFSIITGAHFFPYAWFYNAKAYLFMSIIISITMMVVGWSISPESLWYIPVTMVLLLAVLIFFLYRNYKTKRM